MLVAATQIPDGVLPVLAAAVLSYMAWMARQSMLTAQANRSTADLVDRLSRDHDRLRSDFDHHVASGRERYVGQLEQQLADLRSQHAQREGDTV